MALGRFNRWQQGLDLLRRTLEQGHVPSQEAFQALVVACGRARRSDRAVELLGRMHQAGLTPPVHR
jgi:pentatricopeptide repeat protein